MSPIARTRPRARTTALVLQSLALVAGALVLLGLGPASGATGPRAEGDEPPVPTSTSLRVSSFNLLGAAHTDRGGSKARYASGARRMGWATRILDQGGVDVVGFQEMETPQYDRFMALRGSTFGIYPGRSFGYGAMSNSIAWRLDTWSLVSATTFKAPYFHGTMMRRPLVLLSNVQTGQQVYFLNTHNPADARGPAQRWRNAAVRIEGDLVNRLRSESPTVPVILTGDMNDRERFFCPITAATELLAANGGSNVDGVCSVPRGSRIDWILGTRDVTFSDYVMRDDALVNRTTDHPVIAATADIPLVTVQPSPSPTAVPLR